MEGDKADQLLDELLARTRDSAIKTLNETVDVEEELRKLYQKAGTKEADET